MFMGDALSACLVQVLMGYMWDQGEHFLNLYSELRNISGCCWRAKKPVWSNILLLNADMIEEKKKGWFGWKIF